MITSIKVITENNNDNNCNNYNLRIALEHTHLLRCCRLPLLSLQGRIKERTLKVQLETENNKQSNIQKTCISIKCQ